MIYVSITGGQQFTCSSRWLQFKTHNWQNLGKNTGINKLSPAFQPPKSDRAALHWEAASRQRQKLQQRLSCPSPAPSRLLLAPKTAGLHLEGAKPICWGGRAIMRWENTSPSLGAPRFQNIFLSQLRTRRSKPQIFFEKKIQNTFQERDEVFLDWARVFHFFLYYLVCFLYNNQAETSPGKSNLLSEDISVRCCTKSQNSSWFWKRKYSSNNLFYGCFWRSQHLFCWKMPTLPWVQHCSFSVQQLFRAAFCSQLEQPER